MRDPLVDLVAQEWANFARTSAPTSAMASRPRAVASDRIKNPWYIPG